MPQLSKNELMILDANFSIQQKINAIVSDHPGEVGSQLMIRIKKMIAQELTILANQIESFDHTQINS